MNEISEDFDKVYANSEKVFQACLRTGAAFGITPADMACCLALVIRKLLVLEGPPELYQERVKAVAGLVTAGLERKYPDTYN